MFADVKKNIINDPSTKFCLKEKLCISFFVDKLLVNKFGLRLLIDENIVSLCIDCFSETPREISYLCAPARRAVSIMLGLPDFKYSNNLKNKIFQLTQKFIDKPEMFLDSENCNNLACFINFNNEFNGFFRPAIINCLSKIMENLFDYEKLFEIVELYTKMSALRIQPKKSDYSFLFPVDNSGSRGWEAVWEIYTERLSGILDNVISCDFNQFQIHSVNIEIMILISLLRSIRNIGYVEISFWGLKNILDKFISILAKKKVLDIISDNISIFLSLILMFISVLAKALHFCIDTLGKEIIYLLHEIYEYSTKISDFTVTSNSLIAIREFYDVSFVTNSEKMRLFLSRSTAFFTECSLNTKLFLSISSSSEINYLSFTGKCSSLIRYYSERESLIVESLKIFGHSLKNSKSNEIFEMVHVMVDFARSFIDFINLTKNGAEFETKEFKSVSKICKNLGNFFNSVMVYGIFHLKCSENPIDQLIEFFDAFTLKFPSRFTVNEFTKAIPKESVENFHPQKMMDIEVEENENIPNSPEDVENIPSSTDDVEEIQTMAEDVEHVPNISEQKDKEILTQYTESNDVNICEDKKIELGIGENVNKNMDVKFVETPREDVINLIESNHQQKRFQEAQTIPEKIDLINKNGKQEPEDNQNESEQDVYELVSLFHV